MQKWWNWLLAFALLCLLFIAIPLTYTEDRSNEQMQLMFDEYIEKFNKSYKNDPTEYKTRFQHFVASVEEIDNLNSESRGPEDQRARYDLTHLSDMSKSEYREIHLSDEKVALRKYDKSFNKKLHDRDGGIQDQDGNESEVTTVRGRQKRSLLPLQVDWRVKGVVGPVRNQGMCGACWAFSTIGTMESMAAIKTGKLETLSVQEVIDCAGLGNSGCAGGDICLLLDWLLITKMGVQTDKQYPLRLKNGACQAPNKTVGVTVQSFTCDNFVGAEEKLLSSIATHGPVAVAVNGLSWQNYVGGVIQFHCSGDPKDLNHAVQLVGYDLTADVPYYIAKNSWGPEFGMSGYVHMAIGSNICGLANEVASVDV